MREIVVGSKWPGGSGSRRSRRQEFFNSEDIHDGYKRGNTIVVVVRKLDGLKSGSVTKGHLSTEHNLESTHCMLLWPG